MKKIYFTITGTKYRHGHEFLETGKKVVGTVKYVLPDGVLCRLE